MKFTLAWLKEHLETDASLDEIVFALTDLGLDTVEQATPGHVATVRRLVLQPLTKAQQGQLQEITRRILSATDGGRPWRPPTG